MEENIVTSEVGQKVLTKDSACPKLPVKYRIAGFCTCFILGFILSFFSSFLFLFGPCSQLKRMFKKTRIVATIICLFCIVFTFIYALFIYSNESGIHKVVLWILIAAQYVSMFWYILSYIPFARTLCKKCCKCLIKNNGKS